MRSVTYLVTWQWRDEIQAGGTTQLYDEIPATDAQRAINKLKKRLALEYSDVAKQFVPLNAIRADL